MDGTAAGAQTGPAQELTAWRGRRVFVWDGVGHDWPNWKDDILAVLAATDATGKQTAGGTAANAILRFELEPAAKEFPEYSIATIDVNVQSKQPVILKSTVVATPKMHENAELYGSLYRNASHLMHSHAGPDRIDGFDTDEQSIGGHVYAQVIGVKHDRPIAQVAVPVFSGKTQSVTVSLTYAPLTQEMLGKRCLVHLENKRQLVTRWEQLVAALDSGKPVWFYLRNESPRPREKSLPAARIDWQKRETNALVKIAPRTLPFARAEAIAGKPPVWYFGNRWVLAEDDGSSSLFHPKRTVNWRHVTPAFFVYTKASQRYRQLHYQQGELVENPLKKLFSDARFTGDQSGSFVVLPKELDATGLLQLSRKFRRY